MGESLTHFDAAGQAVMVDVGSKAATARRAVAHGFIKVSAAVFAAVRDGSTAKGDVLGVARIAGIMAAKKTSDIIPLCHPLLLTKCSLDFKLHEAANAIEAVAEVRVSGQTGVEMEALHAVTAALLTIYDMCKAIDKTMEIEGVCLLSKDGGKSGSFINPKQVNDAER